MITLFKILAVMALVATILTGIYKVEKHIEGIGYDNGIAAQKAIDQPKFDEYNTSIANNKLEANRLLAKANADIVAGLAREDEFKATLEKAREINRNQTNDIARQLAGVKLRFASKPAPQATGCGNGGGSPSSPETKTTINDAAPICVVSDAVDAALKSIAFDADTLRDDYTQLYNWAHRDD